MLKVGWRSGEGRKNESLRCGSIGNYSAGYVDEEKIRGYIEYLICLHIAACTG